MTPASTVTVDVHVHPDDLRRTMLSEVALGLTSSPKSLPPKYFYDDEGSRLFDEITRLPEYYPTRCEREILETRAAEIVATSGADTLVELGSGTSEKTRLLLDAFTGLKRFMPFDVSEGILREAAAQVATDYPGVDVHAVVGDFEHHLDWIPDEGSRMIAFLGGTIGNFGPVPRASFLTSIAGVMREGDSLLLGTDLVKDPARLEAAYNDEAGITARFNRNVLHVLNRDLDADFDVDAFDHIARWDDEHEWIEMMLRPDSEQIVHVPALELEVNFDAGELMRTELSCKFRRDRVEAELSAAGLRMTSWWTDAAGDFGLSLSVPA